MNFFRKRKNLHELINIPIKAEERSVIQISLRTQDPNLRQAQSVIRVKNHSWSTIHCVFKIRESARFTAQIHNPRAFWVQIRRSENLFNPLIQEPITRNLLFLYWSCESTLSGISLFLENSSFGSFRANTTYSLLQQRLISTFALYSALSFCRYKIFRGRPLL